jgi:hypothetical protein
MKRWISAVALGVIVTLATGFMPTSILMGATHYGLPLSWLTRLTLAPEYDPWRVNMVNLIVDTAFWTVVSLLAIHLIKRMKT